MIKVFKISTIVYMMLVLCAPSCEDEQETANREIEILMAAKKDIRAEFETDYLNEASLYAYETTANQKLTDLFDYIQIMTDTSLDMSFRLKASEMIKNTFLSDNVTVELIGENKDAVNEQKVSLLISNGLKNKLPGLYYSVDSIQVFEPLHRIDNKTYSGILWFLQNFTNPAKPGQNIKSIKRYTDFYVLKENKVFGTDLLKIWNVRLGQIR